MDICALAAELQSLAGSHTFVARTIQTGIPLILKTRIQLLSQKQKYIKSGLIREKIVLT